MTSSVGTVVLARFLAVALGSAATGFLTGNAPSSQERSAEESQRHLVETLRGCASLVSVARTAAGELISQWDLRRMNRVLDATRGKLEESLGPILPLLQERQIQKATQVPRRRQDLDQALGALVDAATRRLKAIAGSDREAEKAAMEDVLDAWQDANRKAVELESLFNQLEEAVTAQQAESLKERQDRSDRILWTVLAGSGALLGIFGVVVVFSLRLKRTFLALDTSKRSLESANALLARAQARTQSILSGAAEGILTTDGQGIILDANRAAEKMFGAGPGDLKGHPLEDVVLCSWGRLRGSREPQVLSTGKRKDGSRFPIEMVFSEVDVDQEILCTALIRDITERKAAEAALVESQRLLSEAQKLGHFGSWEWEILPDCVTWSEELYRIFGVDFNEFSPSYTGFLDRVHPEDRAGVASLLETAIRNREPYYGEFRILRPAGEVRIVYSRGEPVMDARDQVVKMVGIAQDITERKKVEMIKNELVASISHELRTPITSIRGSLGLIVGGVVGTIPPQAKVMLDIAHQNSERLVLLVNDILDIEKLASGKMVFDLQPHVLRDLVEKAVDANRGYGLPLGVTLKILPPLPDGHIRIDQDRFMQVMANLISNACKFSPSGSTVEIAVGPSGDGLRVSVTDHGPGIPKKFRSRIFQKFAQADGGDNRKTKGTGLGLAICKGMIEQMNGTIGFDSEPGRGTTFFFNLPVLGNAAAGADRKTTENANRPGGLQGTRSSGPAGE